MNSGFRKFRRKAERKETGEGEAGGGGREKEGAGRLGFGEGEGGDCLEKGKIRRRGAWEQVRGGCGGGHVFLLLFAF